MYLRTLSPLYVPKQEGGLGVRSNYNIIMTFIGKLGWHMITLSNHIWDNLFRAKFSEERCLLI